MKIFDGKTYRDMTTEEIAELEKMQAEIPAPVPSPEDRLKKLEDENRELKAMIAKLSGQSLPEEVPANA